MFEKKLGLDTSPFLIAIEMLFYECRIQCHLLTCNKSIAIKEVHSNGLCLQYIYINYFSDVFSIIYNRLQLYVD